MAKRKKRGLPHWLLTLTLGSIIAYLAFNVVLCQVTISSKKQELATVQAQLATQCAQNQELERELAGNDDTIMERVARDELGYAKPNERVFVDVSGK